MIDRGLVVMKINARTSGDTVMHTKYIYIYVSDPRGVGGTAAPVLTTSQPEQIMVYLRGSIVSRTKY